MPEKEPILQKLRNGIIRLGQRIRSDIDNLLLAEDLAAGRQTYPFMTPDEPTTETENHPQLDEKQEG